MTDKDGLQFEAMISMDRELDAMSDKMMDSKRHYTLIRKFLSNQIELSRDLAWQLYLRSLTLKDHDLDGDIWSINRKLAYPERMFEEMSKLLEFYDDLIEKIDSDLVKEIESSEDDIVAFIKILLIIKVYSLALRRYPQRTDAMRFDSITGESHWVKYAAKCLVYTNSGCENTYTIGYEWTYEKTNEYCKGHAGAFFIGSIGSAAFWVPLTALIFNNLAKKYDLNHRVKEFINCYNYKIRGVFFQEEKGTL